MREYLSGVDLSHWNLRDSYTAAQAAALAVGFDPKSSFLEYDDGDANKANSIIRAIEDATRAAYDLAVLNDVSAVFGDANGSSSQDIDALCAGASPKGRYLVSLQLRTAIATEFAENFSPVNNSFRAIDLANWFEHNGYQSAFDFRKKAERDAGGVGTALHNELSEWRLIKTITVDQAALLIIGVNPENLSGHGDADLARGRTLARVIWEAAREAHRHFDNRSVGFYRNLLKDYAITLDDSGVNQNYDFWSSSESLPNHLPTIDLHYNLKHVLARLQRGQNLGVADISHLLHGPMPHSHFHPPMETIAGERLAKWLRDNGIKSVFAFADRQEITIPEAFPFLHTPPTAEDYGDIQLVRKDQSAERSTTSPQPIPPSRHAAQEQAILQTIRELNHDPQKLPSPKPGKPGVKKAARERLDSDKLFRPANSTKFDKAWERLSKTGDIRYEK